MSSHESERIYRSAARRPAPWLAREARACLILRRYNAGETLLHAFARFATRIAANIILINRLRFLKLAVLLKRKTQELLGFGAVLVLGIPDNLSEELDRFAKAAAFEGGPAFVHRGGHNPQIRIGNRGSAPVFDDVCCAGVRGCLSSGVSQHDERCAHQNKRHKRTMDVANRHQPPPKARCLMKLRATMVRCVLSA